MAMLGLQDGDEYAILIHWNGSPIAEVTGTVVSQTETAVSLYLDGDEALIVVSEILHIGAGAARFQLEKPRLKEMLKARIAELKAAHERAESEPPHPDDVNEIPF